MEHLVLHSRLPSAPWMVPAQRRLPGVQPLDMAGWLVLDEAHAGQMALRDWLLAGRRDAVLAQLPGAEDAAAEVLETVLAHLPSGFTWSGRAVTRPDGVRVDLDADTPLATAARLVQEDLCILEKPVGAGEHVLTAACLCFPASWTLAEKIGRPLGAIHGPVAAYGAEMTARVQRMFDAIRPGRPLWRQNALLYARPDLHQPRSEADPREEAHLERPYLRSERQCLLRLPQSGAILFSIHTYVLPVTALTPDQKAALEAFPIDQAGHGG
jgi:dimethylamine monooxygenase subunit A